MDLETAAERIYYELASEGGGSPDIPAGGPEIIRVGDGREFIRFSNVNGELMRLEIVGDTLVYDGVAYSIADYS